METNRIQIVITLLLADLQWGRGSTMFYRTGAGTSHRQAAESPQGLRPAAQLVERPEHQTRFRARALRVQSLHAGHDYPVTEG
jgi:hypothetical protein